LLRKDCHSKFEVVLAIEDARMMTVFLNAPLSLIFPASYQSPGVWVVLGQKLCAAFPFLVLLLLELMLAGTGLFAL